MDNSLASMSTLINFLSSMFGAIFSTFEYWANILLNELPTIFGLSMGNWVLLFMATGIILGDFIK